MVDIVANKNNMAAGCYKYSGWFTKFIVVTYTCTIQAPVFTKHLANFMPLRSASLAFSLAVSNGFSVSLCFSLIHDPSDAHDGREV